MSIDARNNIRFRYVSVTENLLGQRSNIRSDIQLSTVYSGLKVIAILLKGRFVLVEAKVVARKPFVKDYLKQYLEFLLPNLQTLPRGMFIRPDKGSTNKREYVFVVVWV